MRDKALDMEMQSLPGIEIKRLFLEKKITAEDFVFTDTIVIPFNMENAICMEPHPIKFLEFEFAGTINVEAIDKSLIQPFTKICFIGGKEVIVKEDLETIKQLSE